MPQTTEILPNGLSLLQDDRFFKLGQDSVLLSAIGVRVGAVFGARFRSSAELAGGVILILMGLKILLEHLGVLG